MAVHRPPEPGTADAATRGFGHAGRPGSAARRAYKMQCNCMIPVPIARAGVQQIAREMGIGEKNADLLAALAVRHGLWQVEEETE